MNDSTSGQPKALPGPSGFLANAHFVWLAFWVAMFMVPFTVLQILFHTFDPTASNFKLWAGLWSRCSLFLAGIRVRATGQTHLDPDRPYVFVSNHQTGGLDIWSHLVGVDHAFGFVAKASLRNIPILGQALRFSASLFVDRSTARKAVESIQEAADRIRNGNSVIIFPEGRRTWSPHTLDFMKGAYQLAVQAGVPIVPIALLNSYTLFDERAKTSRPGTVEIVIGEPIDTKELTRQNIPELVSTTRIWIQDCLDRYHCGEAPPFKTNGGSVSSPLH